MSELVASRGSSIWLINVATGESLVGNWATDADGNVVAHAVQTYRLGG